MELFIAFLTELLVQLAADEKRGIVWSDKGFMVVTGTQPTNMRR